MTIEEINKQIEELTKQKADLEEKERAKKEAERQAKSEKKQKDYNLLKQHVEAFNKTYGTNYALSAEIDMGNLLDLCTGRKWF